MHIGIGTIFFDADASSELSGSDFAIAKVHSHETTTSHSVANSEFSINDSLDAGLGLALCPPP